MTNVKKPPIDKLEANLGDRVWIGMDRVEGVVVGVVWDDPGLFLDEWRYYVSTDKFGVMPMTKEYFEVIKSDDQLAMLKRIKVLDF
jgi:hypothetical protein